MKLILRQSVEEALCFFVRSPAKLNSCLHEIQFGETASSSRGSIPYSIEDNEPSGNAHACMQFAFITNY